MVKIVLPLVVFVTLSIITIALCHQYAEHDEEIIRRHTQSTAERIRVRIQDFIEERLSSLEVLVDRWVERTPPDFSYRRYRQFAETYFKHYPGFRAINWVDKQGVVRWVYPERENSAALGKYLPRHVLECFARAQGNKKCVITPCMDLLQGSKGFSTYWPVVCDGKLHGYIEGAFDIREIVESRLGKDIFDEFRLLLFEGNRIVYQRSRDHAFEAAGNLRVRRVMRFQNTIWHLELEPLQESPARSMFSFLGISHPRYALFLFFGLTLSIGLSFLLYSLMHRMQMYQLARDKALFEVNERNQAEKALRESEEKQKALLASIPDIVMQIDLNGIRTWCNDAGYEFFGDDVIGKTEDHYMAGDRDLYRLQPLFEGKDETAYIESRQQRKDGQPRLLAWWYRRLRDHSGQVIGAICTARDITDQRRLEEERENLLRELSDKNAELESFVYTVSHDLKTPIVTVEGFIGALKEDFGGIITEQGNKYLNRMSEATHKMEELINDLLDLSRIGRITEKKAEISYSELAKQAVRTLYPQIQARGIEVKVPDGLPALYGEKKRLAQVVDNLLANAVKYIGKDNQAPRIEVGAEQRDGETVFFVRDNGIGIDKVYFDKIFKIFQRLPAAKSIEGTGMGLTIVKRIVELHGGRVWIESEKGTGSTFYFTIGTCKA